MLLRSVSLDLKKTAKTGRKWKREKKDGNEKRERKGENDGPTPEEEQGTGTDGKKTNSITPIHKTTSDQIPMQVRCIGLKKEAAAGHASFMYGNGWFRPVHLHASISVPSISWPTANHTSRAPPFCTDKLCFSSAVSYLGHNMAHELL